MAIPVSVRMNTQVDPNPPPVDAYHGPIMDEIRGLIDQLRQRRMSPDRYLAAVVALYRRVDIVGELRDWTARSLAEQKDQILFRRSDPPHRETLQLLYLHPREVHPPHAHHNLVSIQTVLHGRCHVREWDRVARLDDSTLLLKLQTDRWFGPGDMMLTTEAYRNAHWFAADESPCVILNFYLLGFQQWTFDQPRAGRRLGRQMLDPTGPAQGDGMIAAREIALEDGYTRFGNRPIADFPMPPVAALGS
jgi:hypothetical protein